jgi:hypothetical protein
MKVREIHFLLVLMVPVILIIGIVQKSFSQESPAEYASRVPEFTFAKTLEEQENQLNTNPQSYSPEDAWLISLAAHGMKNIYE